MMRTTDNLIAPARGTLRQALTYAAQFRFPNADQDVSEYLTEVFRLAPMVGLDPSIVVAQSCHETGNWSSRWWVTRRNPAGIGVTGDPIQDEASKTFKDGTEAARAQIAHLAIYAETWPWSADSPRQMLLNTYYKTPAGYNVPIVNLDPRINDVIRAGWAGTVRTIDDLTGRWAVDPHYAEGIVARGNAIFSNLPDQEDTPPMPTGIPTILIDAGHRSTDRTGNPAETDLTDDLARAYVTELRRRDFPAVWLQRDIDMDRDPDDTVGTLDTVGRTMAAWMTRTPGDLLMLSCHYNGSHSPLHAIVPDNRGLTTRVLNGAPSDDTASVNILDHRLLTTIMERMAADDLGTLFRGKLGTPGLMSETETGVGLDGFRLAVFAYTAPFRDRAVRGVIEHGGTSDPAARRFADFARAAADAIEAVYGTATTPSTTTTPKPRRTTTTTTTTTAGPPALPPGMSHGLAEALFNPAGIAYPAGSRAFFMRGDVVSDRWLLHVLSTATGGRWDRYRWPALASLTERGDGRLVVAFTDGFVFEVAP